jgi:transcriptional regulator with XRE-family HTH domain
MSFSGVRMNKQRTPCLDPEVGRALAVLRSIRGWSQGGLALASGVSASNISDYERGKRVPKLVNLERLLAAMGFDLGALKRARSFYRELQEGYDIPSEADRALVPKLWERLKRYSAKEREIVVVEGREYHSWALAEFLGRHSATVAANDPAEALSLAALAVQIAMLLPGESPWLSKVRCDAWAHLGNTRRITGDLRGAHEAFGTSDRYWKAAQREPSTLLEGAQALGMKASLRRSQRKLPEALTLIEEALSLVRDDGLRGALLINKGKILEESGRLGEAIELLHEAEPLVDVEDDPRLYLCLRHNLVDYLSKSDRPQEASVLLPAVAALTKTAGSETDRIRLEWTRGRIEAGLGRRDEAIRLLDRVRVEFASRSLAYDTALVCLELASLYAEEGSHGQVKSLARHMVPIFQAQDVHREAQAALSAFRQAAEAQQASVELVRRVLDFLYRARHHAGLRFEG